MSGVKEVYDPRTFSVVKKDVSHLTYRFKIPIGDWSGDGHGRCEWYDVLSNKPTSAAYEAHRKSVSILDIENLFEPPEGYDSYRVLDADDELIKERIEKVFPEFEDDVYSYSLAAVWCALLMKADPELELVIDKVDVFIPISIGYDLLH